MGFASGQGWLACQRWEGRWGVGRRLLGVFDRMTDGADMSEAVAVDIQALEQWDELGSEIGELADDAARVCLPDSVEQRSAAVRTRAGPR